MNFLYPSIFLSISRVHIHRLFRSLTSSSLSSSLHQFTLDSSPYIHLLPISSSMESTVEVSALDLLSRRWSRMKRKRKLGNVFLIWFMDFSCSRQLCIYLPKVRSCPWIVGGLYLSMLGAQPEAIVIMGRWKCRFFIELWDIKSESLFGSANQIVSSEDTLMCNFICERLKVNLCLVNESIFSLSI